MRLQSIHCVSQELSKNASFPIDIKTIYIYFFGPISSFSDLSEANTIQAIPIPKNKSDVEAFLDDIFDRALDTSDPLINPKKYHQNVKTSGTRPLQKRIKGGNSSQKNKCQLILDVSSWDDINSLNDYSLDSSMLYSTMTTNTSSSSYCCDSSAESSCGADEMEKVGCGLIIPNKEYEYTKMLRMFLGNKQVLTQWKQQSEMKDDEDKVEKRIIYSAKNSAKADQKLMKLNLSNASSSSENG
jgi:hypothetical protein